MTMETREEQRRMDLRLKKRQRLSCERTVALGDQTHSQRSTGKLVDAARCDTEEATATVLSPEAFDAFCKMLEEPMSQAARDLLAREEIWA